MKKAFSMLSAIVMIVLMSSVAAMVFGIAGKSVKESTVQYRKEQAILLAKSYTEYAILAIQGRDMQNNGCVTTITGLVNSTSFDQNNTNGAIDGEGYQVTVRIQYLDVQNIPAACGNILVLDIGAGIPNNPSALIDVNIRYRDLSHMSALRAAGQTQAQARANAQFLQYNRRTLQRL